MACAVLRLLAHPVAQPFQPRAAVVVVKRDACAHFVAVGLGVEIIAFGKGAMQLLLQGFGNGGFAAAADAHDDVVVGHKWRSFLIGGDRH